MIMNTLLAQGVEMGLHRRQLPYISGFIAGARKVGTRCAKATNSVLNRSSAIPVASLAMALAVAGATKARSRALRQGQVFHSPAVSGLERVHPHRMAGEHGKARRRHETLVAWAVMTTCTSAPCCFSRRSSRMRLEGGDAAGDCQNRFPAIQLIHDTFHDPARRA